MKTGKHTGTHKATIEYLLHLHEDRMVTHVGLAANRWKFLYLFLLLQ